MKFDMQPSLLGELVTIEPLKSEHFDALYRAASNPQTWAGHPAHDRHKKPVFEAYFTFLLDAGSTVLVRDLESGAAIGCSRYYVSPDQPEGIGIGFTFLDCAFWGGRVNLDLKCLMVGHALTSFPSVWFHIAPTNIRSQIATTRLGAEFRYDADLTLGVKEEPWKVYELTAKAWQNTLTARRLRQPTQTAN